MTASPAQEFLPFVRPDIDGAAIAEVGKVLASGWITSGPKMQAFESALSDLFGGRPVRTFANGSATMEIALRIADIGPGDEVITTPITWVATANVVLTVGARPVFVDVDPRTRNLDLDAVEAAITPRTRAIMPVYLSGLPVDMDRLYAIAARHGLRVIEDAAQAIDARWRGQRIGAFGDLASFSFQANKNITTIEGGCLVMNSPEEAQRAERLRLQGVIRTGMDGMDVEEPGGKFNLTDVNAAIGLQQLAKLDAITTRRAMLAETYFRCAAANGMAELGVELPLPRDGEAATTNWHMFQVVLPTERMAGGPAEARKRLMEAMRERGIGTGVHYPPVHLFTYYRSLGWREGMLPHAERIGRGIVTLPLFPAMQPADVERVCEIFTETCKRLSH
ncbi:MULTISPECIES: DegT/DnrJ/EryC1/StrS family aminotransferase [unclassified Cupriavidus]|uniref:DegT/DnrJ/EryC1/StrS family aminotransferase n=1 Tax=Cupriavidus sp. H19C3 TaxID=3241603 RepID=UPI003BF8718F